MSPNQFADPTDEALKRLMYYAPWVARSQTPKEAGCRLFAVADRQVKTMEGVDLFDLAKSLLRLSLEEHPPAFKQPAWEWVQHLWRYNGSDASDELAEIETHEKMLRMMVVTLMTEPDRTPEMIVAELTELVARLEDPRSEGLTNAHVRPSAAVEAHRRFHASQMGTIYGTLRRAWDASGTSRDARLEEWKARLRWTE